MSFKVVFITIFIAGNLINFIGESILEISRGMRLKRLAVAIGNKKVDFENFAVNFTPKMFIGFLIFQKHGALQL